MLGAVKAIRIVLCRLLEAALILAVVVLVVDVLWGVFTRKVLGDQAQWSEELARFLLIWISLLGGAVAFGEKAHLGVDYFVIKHCSDSEYKEIGIDYKDYIQIEDVLKEAETLSSENYVVQAKWDKIRAGTESPLYKDGYRKYDVCYGTPILLQISGNGKVYQRHVK